MLRATKGSEKRKMTAPPAESQDIELKDHSFQPCWFDRWRWLHCCCMIHVYTLLLSVPMSAFAVTGVIAVLSITLSV